MDKFKAGGRKLSPRKDDRNKLMRTFTGERHSKLKMNGEVILDFEKDLPYTLKSFECPIASDSSFRPDVQWMIKKDINRAQEEKDRIEDLQR